jgi:hypothetical protein
VGGQGQAIYGFCPLCPPPRSANKGTIEGDRGTIRNVPSHGYNLAHPLFHTASPSPLSSSTATAGSGWAVCEFKLVSVEVTVFIANSPRSRIAL